MPFVGGVRFTNIDSQEIGVILVVVEDLDDVADLATEGRSSKTTEDEDEWFGAGAFANMKVVSAVERKEASVGSRVADLEIAAVHVRQCVAKHVEGVPGPAGHHAEDDVRDDDERAETDADPHGNFPHDENLPCKRGRLQKAAPTRANLVREGNNFACAEE